MGQHQKVALPPQKPNKQLARGSCLAGWIEEHAASAFIWYLVQLLFVTNRGPSAKAGFEWWYTLPLDGPVIEWVAGPFPSMIQITPESHLTYFFS